MTLADGLLVRRAARADAAPLKTLIESGYRGDSARRGWTHEADIVENERIAMDDLCAMLGDPSTHFLIAEDAGKAIGCIAVTDKGHGRAYFGLLCVDPARQSNGLGSRLIEAAEERARSFGASVMEISVFENRAELIVMYQRKGYCDTGRRDPFPTPQPVPLFFRCFEKRL